MPLKLAMIKRKKTVQSYFVAAPHSFSVINAIHMNQNNGAHKEFHANQQRSGGNNAGHTRTHTSNVSMCLDGAKVLEQPCLCRLHVCKRYAHQAKRVSGNSRKYAHSQEH